MMGLSALILLVKHLVVTVVTADLNVKTNLDSVVKVVELQVAQLVVAVKTVKIVIWILRPMDPSAVILHGMNMELTVQT